MTFVDLNYYLGLRLKILHPYYQAEAAGPTASATFLFSYKSTYKNTGQCSKNHDAGGRLKILMLDFMNIKLKRKALIFQLKVSK